MNLILNFLNTFKRISNEKSKYCFHLNTRWMKYNNKANSPEFQLII